MTHFAREYGNALFELATEEKITEEISEQLELLNDCFTRDPEYLRLLATRSVDCDERIALMEKAFGEAVHPYLLNFLKILLRRGAIDRFHECEACYRVLYNERCGIAEAHAVSAVPLSDAQKTALIKKLEALTGKKIRLSVSQDDALIGGLRVDVEGKRYDNTIQTRLDRMRRHLAEDQ